MTLYWLKVQCECLITESDLSMYNKPQLGAGAAEEGSNDGWTGRRAQTRSVGVWTTHLSLVMIFRYLGLGGFGGLGRVRLPFAGQVVKERRRRALH
jgi:hypothetical protein